MKDETKLSSAADYIEAVLASSPPVTMTEEPACEACWGSGEIIVRHPELDDVLFEIVWLTEPCHCPIGQALQDEYETKAFAAQERSWEAA